MVEIMYDSETLIKKLYTFQDEEYREFNSKLIPGMPEEYFIGIRIPALRKFAKEFARDGYRNAFMRDLPHKYHEENLLHAFLIEENRDFDCVIDEVETFLPYVDNWAVCDSMNPKALKKDLEITEKKAFEWMGSNLEYTVRYGIGVLMRYFLDDRFETRHAEAVAGIVSDRYYVRMMQAWYFATALAKQYDAVIGYVESGRFDKWLRNRIIQKAVESYRVSDEHKAYLKTLRQR